MINDDTLILYFYNDGLSGSERQLVQDALEQSPDLGARYARLCEDLEQIGVGGDYPSPAGAAAGWRHALDAQVEKENVSSSRLALLGKRRFALAAAAAFVFVAGWWFGGEANRESPSEIPGLVVGTSDNTSLETVPVVPKVPVVFVRGVSTHLERAQIQLASLDMGNDVERVGLIDQIVSQNRSFLQAADKNGADDVARLLRAFEPLLLEMMSDEQPRVAQEQARDQLEFELGVTLTKFARQASNKTNEF